MSLKMKPLMTNCLSSLRNMKKEITIDDLLKIEADYIDKQRAIPKIHTKEQGVVPANYDDKLFFFNQGHIAIQANNLTNDLKQDLSKWQLTKFEMLMLLCYQGDLSAVFDNGDPLSSPYPINEMCKSMDSVLMKAPVCTDTTFYRQHRKNDVVDFKEGEIRTFPSYLTTSIKNWNQPNHQLIITPNLSHTNAKALYKIRNDKEEYQVNFKRGTSFLIEKVEPFEEDGIEFKRIWMKEL